MNLKELSLTDLKALAYDTIAALENGQKALQAINTEIQSRAKEDKPEATPA